MEQQKSSKTFAVISSLGTVAMLLEFLRQITRLTASVINKSNNSSAFYVLLSMISVFSLLSCFYFAFCSMSFGKQSYDLSRLGVFHMAPMLWAGTRVIYLVYEGESPLSDRWLLLKYALASIMLFYFYFYLSVILNPKKNVRVLEICSYVFCAVTLMYFVQTLIMLFKGKCSVLDNNAVFAYSSLLLSSYALFFKTEYIVPKENGE